MIVVKRKPFLEALRAVAAAPAVYVVLTAKAGAAFGRIASLGRDVRIDHEFPIISCDQDAEGAFASSQTTKYLAECPNDEIEIRPDGLGFKFFGTVPSFKFSPPTERGLVLIAPHRRPVGGAVGTVSAALLADEFNRVASFAASGDARYAFDGVLFDNADGVDAEHSWLVATSGSVFVASRVPFNAGRFLIPAAESKRFAAALDPRRSVEVFLSSGGENAVFASRPDESPAFYFSSVLLCGAFPEREPLFKAHGKNTTFRAVFSDAGRAASEIYSTACVDEKKRRVELKFQGGKFLASSTGAEVGSSNVVLTNASPAPIDAPQEGATAKFSADLLAPVLKRFFVAGPVCAAFGSSAILLETPDGGRVALVATVD